MEMEIDKEGMTNICGMCGETCFCALKLNVHKKTHSDKKPYQCKQCGKMFSQLKNLKRHRRVHTGERPYQCQQCGKTFAASDNLRQHIRLHTGEKPYECKQCGKKFNQSVSLNVHLRVHTGEKPHQCDQCLKKFASFDGLYKHMRVHTGEKPYQCKRCGKNFSQSSSRNVHMRVHTGEKPHKCKQCGKKYSQATSLTVHMKVHSREEMIAQKHIESALSLSKFLCNHNTHLFAQNVAIQLIEDNLFSLQAIPVSGYRSCSSSVVFSILNHPNIAVTYGVTVSTCGSMLVMEKVVTCLSHLLAQVDDEVTVRERVDICYGIVCAVDYLHHHVGIVHGYIKVDNVFVTSRFTAKLLDPSAAFLMHDKMCQRAESFASDLHHLVRLLIAMLYNKHPTFIYACDRLHDMISSGDVKKEREECMSTSKLLQILDELRDSEAYCYCSRNRQLSWKD